MPLGTNAIRSDRLFPRGSDTRFVSYPRKDTSTSRVPAGTASEKRPASSVAVPNVVPFTTSEAYGSPSPVIESVTTPAIVRFCA